MFDIPIARRTVRETSITVRFDDDEVADIDRIAAANDVTRSDVIRTLMKVALNTTRRHSQARQ